MISNKKDINKSFFAMKILEADMKTEA